MLSLSEYMIMSVSKNMNVRVSPTEIVNVKANEQVHCFSISMSICMSLYVKWFIEIDKFRKLAFLVALCCAGIFFLNFFK